MRLERSLMALKFVDYFVEPPHDLFMQVLFKPVFLIVVRMKMFCHFINAPPGELFFVTFHIRTGETVASELRYIGFV